MKKSASPVKGKPFGAFEAQYDKSFIVPKKIKDALASLGESWLPEGDFIKLAGLSTTDLARFREPFESNIVVAPSQHGKAQRRLWVGSTKLADKMRERVS